MKIVFCTQNMAPFRMRWMDEMAKYHTVVIYHLNEYEKGLNLNYISYNPSRAVVKYKAKKLFGKINIFDVHSIAQENADVYILDGYGFIGQQLLILSLNKKRIPFILSIDGGFISYDESKVKRCLKTFFISKAKAYFSTSEETDKFIDYYGGKNKIKYRHFFSNINKEYILETCLTKEQKNQLKKELEMSENFTIIAVGKFEYRKGFDLLLKALEKINKDITIYFIGAEKCDEYDEFINPQNESKITFVGFCDQLKLKKYYMAADLFILPTREDIWGLVISEAMANGIPVVTSDRCLAGVAMLEKDDIVPSENVDALCAEIDRYYKMTFDERKCKGEKNLEKVKKYAIEESTLLDIEHIKKYRENN